MQTPAQSRSNELWTCGIIAIVVWACFSFLFVGDIVIDDAYIVLRHARNFAAGYGLNFNLNEHVEGYTSFLFALLQSIPYFLHIDPVFFTHLLGLPSLLGFLTATYYLGRKILGEKTTIFPPLALALTANVGYMSVWGLETITYCALLTSGIAAAAYRRPLLAGLFLNLAALTRMEAMIPAFIVGCYFLFLWRAHVTEQLFKNFSPSRFCRAPPVIYGVTFLALFVPYFLIRAHYYDAWMPNTYTSKVGTFLQMAPRGLRFVKLIYARPGFICIPIISLLGIWQLIYSSQACKKAETHEEDTQNLPIVWLLFVIIAAYHAYIARVGGDFYLTFRDRFFIHFYGIFYVFLFWSVENIMRTVARKYCVSLNIAFLQNTTKSGLLFLLVVIHLLSGPYLETHLVTGWKTLGLYLKEHSPPGSILAVDAAGAVPYFSELPTIDMLGKADRHIGTKQMPNMGQGPAAHEKSDIPYVLGRTPTWITTWIHFQGEDKRGLRYFYNFRTKYQLVALLDVDRKDVSETRLHFLTADDLDNDVLKHSHKKAERWGLFHLRDQPLTRITISADDLNSAKPPSLVAIHAPYMQNDTSSDIATIAATASGDVLQSIPIHYPQGTFHLIVDFAYDSSAAAEPVGRIEIVKLDNQVISTLPLTTHDTKADVPFTVAASDAESEYKLRIVASGGHTIHILHAEVGAEDTH